MSTRLHRNYELCDCVGVQLAVAAGDRVLVDNVKLLYPAQKGHCDYEEFLGLIEPLYDPKTCDIKHVMFRDEINKRTYLVRHAHDFEVLRRAQVRDKEIAIFTVSFTPKAELVKPTEPKVTVVDDTSSSSVSGL